jgi:hypothetical protein
LWPHDGPKAALPAILPQLRPPAHRILLRSSNSATGTEMGWKSEQEGVCEPWFVPNGREREAATAIFPGGGGPRNRRRGRDSPGVGKNPLQQTLGGRHFSFAGPLEFPVQGSGQILSDQMADAAPRPPLLTAVSSRDRIAVVWPTQPVAPPAHRIRIA